MKTYEETGRRIGRLVGEKQEQYGKAHEKVEKMLEILFPDGIYPPYHGVSILIRMLDKVCRIAAGNKGEENAWEDIAGYAILKITIDQWMEALEKENKLMAEATEETYKEIQELIREQYLDEREALKKRLKEMLDDLELDAVQFHKTGEYTDQQSVEEAKEDIISLVLRLVDKRKEETSPESFWNTSCTDER